LLCAVNLGLVRFTGFNDYGLDADYIALESRTTGLQMLFEIAMTVVKNR